MKETKFYKAHCKNCGRQTPHIDNYTTGLNCQVCILQPNHVVTNYPAIGEYSDAELMDFYRIIDGQSSGAIFLKIANVIKRVDNESKRRPDAIELQTNIASK